MERFAATADAAMLRHVPLADELQFLHISTIVTAMTVAYGPALGLRVVLDMVRSRSRDG